MDDEDDDDQTDDQYDDEIKNGGINGQETGNGVNSNAEEVPKTAVEEEGQEENNVDEESLAKTGDNRQFEIPPGYTVIEGSETSGINKEDGTSNNYEKVNEVNVEEFQKLSGNGCSKYSKEVESDSICSGRFKKSKGPKTGSSILNLLDGVVKVGHVMGYKMDGCMSNVVEIIESQGAEENCWGNLGFEYVHSDSVGNSRGILCVWDPNSFCKSIVTILDSFVMMWGVWRQSGKDVLLIAVYAPHDFKEKMAGLVEVSLGGCSFTLCHKSATKMSKLDLFLVSETLFNSCPNISALSLESDLEGFGNVVEAAWKEYPNVEQNAMINMMGKLKHLKKKIREWNIKDKQRRSIDKDKYKVDLKALDMIIDQGNGNEEIVKQRSEISELEGEVSNDEIKRAVWDCGMDKAPGPDGFTFGFYRRFWYLIDNDVYAAVKHFFIHKEPKGCNSSFIALILKIPDANLVKDFRPISLIGSLYKIIAKILSNRLAGVLGDIVNEVQSAFVADRHILDGPFILNEVIQWCKSKKKQSLVFKVDFEKAYDSVRWDFLDDILRKFGFGDKWRMWIQSCLKSSRVMKSLHLSFQRVEEAEMFKGIKIGPMVTLSHMFYADDAVFVRKWCESNITTLVYVLDCFHRESGLKINMSKIKILGVYVESERVNEAALRLGCFTLKTPFLYLGSKVGGSMSRLHEWDEKVLSSKDKGGLGVSSLYALNRGLLFKWIWRSYTQHKSLWVRVIKAMYGDKGKIDAEELLSLESLITLLTGTASAPIFSLACFEVIFGLGLSSMIKQACGDEIRLLGNGILSWCNSEVVYT
nr:RNA-directed DNA polymerase, eukaryota [Tanacetum cinerariifolium]